tara:strand:+ start:716 stop:817 length:102 start_codon:yes stop_codon:yes gene_type:complete
MSVIGIIVLAVCLAGVAWIAISFLERLAISRKP